MNPNCLPAPYLAYGHKPVVHTPRKQRTIAEPAALEGFGYWSGKDVRVEFRPAPEHTGIVFVRCDLIRRVRIPASVAHRVDVPRRTTLLAGGATVEMVEHLLAALYGLQIDNCEVWIDQPELPGCDGSSQPFVECLDRAGTIVQNAWRNQVFVNRTVRVGTTDSWIEARPATPGSGLSARYRLDYGLGNGIGRQTYQVHVMPETFRTELAPCRTFMLKSEAEWLLAQGLGQRATMRDLLVFDDHGPIDNELRFTDECVRHKVLDMVGDLSLSGCDLIGNFVAHRSGHKLNAQLVQAVLQECEHFEWRRSA